MYKIRFYKKTDYSQVKAILQEANSYDKVWDSEENLSGMIDKDQKSILVAVSDNHVVGNIFITPYGTKVAYLFRLAVKKEYRNQGIATKLLKQAESLCKKRGVKEIAFFVNKDKNELKAFYNKRKFKTSENSIAFNCFWKTIK